MKKGTELELEIESLAFGAEAVARHEGIVIFVPGGLPGQRVLGRILRKKKGLHRAQILEVLRQSPDQIQPRCAHFGDCGGCAIQHFDYNAQISQKQQQVTDALRRIGNFSTPNIEPIHPSPGLFFYRNKMEFTFSRRRWFPQAQFSNENIQQQKNFALGMNVKGFYNKTLQIDQCYLQSDICNRIRNNCATFCRDSDFLPYSTADHNGFWRFLVVREGKNTGEILVNLVTADRGQAGENEIDKLAAVLQKSIPEITTIVHSVNRSKAQVAVGDTVRVVSGPGYIYERLGDFRYRISANSFFQTNTRGAEILYQLVAEYAGLTGSETVCDFYCGAGSIGIYLSKKAKNVIGIEIIDQAIEDAKINARLNNAANCNFIAGDLKDILHQQKSLIFTKSVPDILVLDPPRVGLHHKVISELIDLKAKRIVYVSCNPTTFARDARVLCEHGYALKKTTAVDMFPHTAHIELVNQIDLIE